MGNAIATDILIVSQLPPPIHGSTLMTKVLLRAINSLGLTWTLVDRRFSRKVEEVGHFSARKVVSAIFLVLRLIFRLLKTKPKIVIYFSTTRGFSFVMDLILSEVLRVFRKEVILYIHTLGYKNLAEKNSFYKSAVTRILRSANQIVILDQELEWDIFPFTSSKIYAIPNTLPDEPPRSTQKISQENITFLFLSNLISGKGYEDFICLAEKASQSSCKFDFVMAGAASEEVIEEISQRRSNLNDPEKLKYIGPVFGNSKWKILSSSTVLIFPSHDEAMPLVPIEALAAGTPVLCYRVGAVAKTIEQGGAGKVIENFDIEEMFNNLIELASDEALLKQMSINAQQIYSTNYSFSEYKRSWERVIKQSNWDSTKLR